MDLSVAYCALGNGSLHTLWLDKSAFPLKAHPIPSFFSIILQISIAVEIFLLTIWVDFFVTVFFL